MLDLQRFRKEKKLTQSDVLEALEKDQGIKVSQGNISKYENGRLEGSDMTMTLLKTFPELKDYEKKQIDLDVISEAVMRHAKQIHDLELKLSEMEKHLFIAERTILKISDDLNNK